MKLLGLLVAFAGPARGRKPDHSSQLLQVLAHILVRVVSPSISSIAQIGWKEVQPPWNFQLTAFVEGTRFRIWPSPSCFGFRFVNSAKSSASGKGSSRNIQQSWWGMHLTQRRAVQKGLSPNAPQFDGKT